MFGKWVRSADGREPSAHLPSQVPGVHRHGHSPTVGRVATTAAYRSARRRIEQLCESPDGTATLRVQLLEELRSVVGFDAYAWLLTDPHTSVGCAPLADVPRLADLPRLIRLKYVTALNRWTTLNELPVATLRAATGGDLDQSLVWRELLHEYDVRDVASSVFADRFGCWGFLDIWRSGPAPSFSDDEVSFLIDIVPTITGALRRNRAHTFLVQASGDLRRLGPVVLLLSRDLTVIGQTPETDRCLRLLVPPAEYGTPIPASAYNVAAQLLAVEAGVDHNPPRARMHLADGVWVTARAARIGDEARVEDRSIAITIEASAPSERLEVFAAAFALTPREGELLGHLAAGSDTRDIARRTFISEHTVQDHLKSIFAKTSAHNRRTLLARALGS